MGYTVPTTRIDEEFINAADWNTDIKDNMDYLKAERDKIDDCVQSQSDLVSFQAGAKFRIITVRAYATDGHGIIWALCDANTPPTTIVALVYVSDDDAYCDKMSFSFMVPPNYYYTITGSGDADVDKVTAWELH